MSELPPHTILTGERDYEAALDMVIAEARDELLIFDQDLYKGGFNSLQRHRLLQNFLSENPLSKLTIILHNTHFFTTQCPRLFELLETYGHKMIVYETNDHAKIAKDCFILADNRHYLRRFHTDQARFKFALEEPEETASLRQRFDELLSETASTVSATELGL